MKKKKTALNKLNNILKKTEGASTPLSIKNKFKKKEKKK